MSRRSSHDKRCATLAPGEPPGAKAFSSTTTLSRRRWLASIGAGFAGALWGCDGISPPQAAAPLGTTVPLPRWVAEPTLNRAVHWLWAQQARGSADASPTLPAAGGELSPAQDGAWRSGTYAQLKTGQALTPWVLRALSRVPYDIAPCGLFWVLAEDFVRKSVSPAGVVGARDLELLEYPNYATALALECLARQGRAEDESLRKRMTTYLLREQYCEAAGFQPDHPAYGGWGFGGPRPVGGSPGHMDLGHTRHVLEALRAAGHDDPATYGRAERFLRLLQKHPTEDRPQPTSANSARPAGWKPPYDGGFYFSPIVLAANKGGEDQYERQPYFRSYATATCDGILALLACGVPRDDERIRAAAAWLEHRPRLDYPAGIPENTNENWGASIRFYHFAVRAECYRALRWPGEWRTELRNQLRNLQQPDGSFVNREGFLMKEDDPILCTALAATALAATMSAATGGQVDDVPRKLRKQR